jgi:hypothetical protein
LALTALLVTNADGTTTLEIMAQAGIHGGQKTVLLHTFTMGPLLSRGRRHGGCLFAGMTLFGCALAWL